MNCMQTHIVGGISFNCDLDLVNSYCLLNIVSVLGQEEGYIVKYGLNLRDCPRAQPEGSPEGSGLILQYIPT